MRKAGGFELGVAHTVERLNRKLEGHKIEGSRRLGTFSEKRLKRRGNRSEEAVRNQAAF